MDKPITDSLSSCRQTNFVFRTQALCGLLLPTLGCWTLIIKHFKIFSIKRLEKMLSILFPSRTYVHMPAGKKLTSRQQWVQEFTSRIKSRWVLLATQVLKRDFKRWVKFDWICLKLWNVCWNLTSARISKKIISLL